jgi:glycosyltransferase involved in cell wall biosynthesis
MNKRFISFFPFYRDFHFYKDPGQVPYRFSREGYDTTIACFSSDEPLPVTESFIKVRRINPLFGRKGKSVGLTWFLVLNSRSADILNLFHFTWLSLLAAWVYKLFNRKGFVYVKMDNCSGSGRYQWEDILDNKQAGQPLAERCKGWLIRKVFVRSVDLWSIEDEKSRKFYEDKYHVFRGKLITVYNGHCADILNATELFEFEEKDDIILNAGRLGSYQKATEILLEAFITVAQKTGYQLHLAGEMEPGFNDWYQKFLSANPELRTRIVYHGPLKREELYGLYNRSKILCMPSRYEGLAIVLCEAMYFKNAVVTTPYISISELLTEESAGVIVNRDDPPDLAQALTDLTSQPSVMKTTGLNSGRVAREKFDWTRIVRALISEINRRSSKG